MSESTNINLMGSTAAAPASTEMILEEPKKMQAFRARIEAVAAQATEADLKVAMEIGESGKPPTYEEINPRVAAVLWVNFNKINRPFSIIKAEFFAKIMNDGHWKKHHQGAAFYPDGSLADAQHRLAAIAISGTTQVLMVSRDFDEDAIDAIDRQVKRTTGQALAMRHIENADQKAMIAKVVMKYEHKLQKKGAVMLDDPSIETWVITNDLMLSDAVDLGENSVRNIHEPSMKAGRAMQIAALLLHGGWPTNEVHTFLVSVQQGVAPYPQAPTLEISRLLIKAQVADRRKDRLRTETALALLVKAAVLFSQQRAVSKLSWNAAKEPFPDFHYPAAPVVH